MSCYQSHEVAAAVVVVAMALEHDTVAVVTESLSIEMMEVVVEEVHCSVLLVSALLSSASAQNTFYQLPNKPSNINITLCLSDYIF